MSVSDNMAVVGCVAAIVTAYHDGGELIHDLRARRQSKTSGRMAEIEQKAMQDLELSMSRGQDVVRSQYERDFRRLGQRFASGDQIARDTLKDIIVHLQKQVIQNLRIALQQDRYVDLLPLNDVSDESQDRAIMCLMQLHQRLLVQAPVDVVTNNFSQRSTSESDSVSPTSRHDPYAEQGLSAAFQTTDPEMRARSKTNSFMRRRRMSDNNHQQHPMIQHVPSITSDYVPDMRREEQYHQVQREEYTKQPSGTSFPMPPRQNTARFERYDDSPTFSPNRLSSVSSISSADPLDRDDPDYNLWCGTEAVSPISSMNGSLSPVSGYKPSLVPEALNPARRPNHSGSSHSRNPSPVPAHGTFLLSHRDSFGDLVEPRRPQQVDQSSVYSQDSKRSKQNPSPHPHPHLQATPQPLPQPNPAPVSRYNSNRSDRSWGENSTGSRSTHSSRSNTANPSIMEQMRNFANSPADGFPIPPQIPPKAPARSLHGNSPPKQIQRRTPPTLYVMPQAPPPPPPPPANHPIHQYNPSTTTVATMHHPNHSTTTVAPSINMLPPQTQMTIRGVSMSSSSGSSTISQPIAKAQPPVKIIPPTGLGLSAKALLPNEDNKFAGLCQGAWRFQIGDLKKSFDERSRPAAKSLSQMSAYYKCKKCNFEGRLTKDAQGKKSIDKKVYGSNDILYRWEFLFKSHVQLEEQRVNPLESSYGCMFCCADGKGTPIYKGLAAFMAHLQEHRHVLPQGEVLYRMNTVVERSPGIEEDFALALPALML